MDWTTLVGFLVLISGVIVIMILASSWIEKNKKEEDSNHDVDEDEPQEPSTDFGTELEALSAQALYLKGIRDTLDWFKLVTMIAIAVSVTLLIIYIAYY